ncbi:MAG: hypothetical protein ABW020_11715 [Candidatus Rokuibacteriota bacterium]
MTGIMMSRSTRSGGVSENAIFRARSPLVAARVRVLGGQDFAQQLDVLGRVIDNQDGSLG